jgi:5-methylcytosine-specific restriction endonuclease McrA
MAKKKLPPVMTRAQAKAAGLKRYWRGTPCLKGHRAERFTSDAHCVVCTDQKFWAWYDENKAHVVAGVKAWREQNPKRHRLQRLRELPANRERMRQWAKDNPERYSQSCKARNHARRSRERNAPGKWTADDIDKLFDQQKRRCAACRVSIKKGYEIDHKQPLSKGGTNYISNIQLLCFSCNRSKGSRPHEVWLAERSL